LNSLAGYSPGVDGATTHVVEAERGAFGHGVCCLKPPVYQRQEVPMPAKRGKRTAKSRTRRVRPSPRAKVARRRSPPHTRRAGAARKTSEARRRAPVEPAALLDQDALEVLRETQDLELEQSEVGPVGEPPVDRSRRTVLAGGDVDA